MRELTVSNWAHETLDMLAQEPGVPVRQMAKGILDYLTNDNAANHQTLKGVAEQAVKEFQQNPARFLGKNLPNLLPGPGELLEGAAAARQLGQVEKAAQRLKAVADTERKFGNSYANAIRQAEQATPPPTLACFAKNACLPTALARADLNKVGGVFGDGTKTRVRGVYAPDPGNLDMAHDVLRGRTADGKTGPLVVEERLQRYGENYQPRNPTSFTPEELAAIQTGTMIPVNGPGQIRDILKNEGMGSHGLVFVEYHPTISEPKPLGHVFNAENMTGIVEFVDDTTPGMTPLFTQSLVKNWYYFPIQ